MSSLLVSSTRRFSRACLIAVVCTTYPVLAMRQVILGSRHSRLGTSLTDMTATLFEIQQLRRMKFPWSYSTRASFPSGEEFWEIYRIVHSVVWLPAWAIVRIASPILTLNIMILIGWVTTGLGAYALARVVGVQTIWALVGAVLVQMLPWFELKATDHLFYMYVGGPILAIAATLRARERPSVNTALIAVFLVGLLFFLDTYLFVFALLGQIVVCCEVAIRRKTRHRFKYHLTKPRLYSWRTATFIGAFVSAAVGVSFFFAKLFETFNEQSLSLGSKDRGITALSDLEQWTGSYSDLITPLRNHWLLPMRTLEGGNTDVVMYGSLVALLIVAVGVAFGDIKRVKPLTWLLFILSIFYILLSVRLVPTIGPSISFSNLVRYITPGIRVFARASIIGQVLVIVLTVLVLNLRYLKATNSLGRISIGLLIPIILVIDISPNLTTKVVTSYDRYTNFENIIERVNNGGGLLLPSGKLEPFELSLYGARDALDFPIHNDSGSQRDPQIYLHASLGVEDFAAYLQQNSIEFVIAQVNETGEPVLKGYIQDAVRFVLTLREPYFNVLARQTTSSGDAVTLLQVSKDPAHTSCAGCKLAQFVTVPQLDYLGATRGQLFHDIFWSPTRSLEIIAEGLEEPRSSESVLIRLKIRTTDANLAFRVRRQDGQEVPTIRRVYGGYEIEFRAKPQETVSVTAEGDCDATKLVQGKYCWGLGEFVAFQGALR